MLWKFKSFLFLLFISTLTIFSQSTDLTEAERIKALKMLRGIVETVKDNYYDQTLKGVKFDELAKKAEDQIRIVNKDILVYSAFADLLNSLNDSHTYFIPPQPEFTYHHGWTMQIIGEKCLVARIEKDNDAIAKGLKVGEQVITLNDVEITKRNFRDLRYFFFVLNPMREFYLEIQGIDGKRRRLTIVSKLQKTSDLPMSPTYHDFHLVVEEYEKIRKLANTRLFEIGQDLIIWKLDSFYLFDEEIDTIMSRIRKSKDLILDLRGNGGGYTETLNRLMGHFFDREVNIGRRVLRKKSKPQIVSARGGSPFKGRLIVLVDSQSASASEHFARIMQIEKRALILGDRTAGALETGQIFQRSINSYDHSYFLSISIEGVILPDGKQIEGVGVTPDEFMIPTAVDIALNRDTALSFAASKLGYVVSPENAFEILEKYRVDIEKRLVKAEVK